MLIRQEVLEKVGGMDEAFFMYSEETDWCYRIRMAGWEITYYPKAEIIHFGGASAGLTIDRMKATWTRSYIYFYFKHFGTLQALLARIILTLGYLWRLLLWSSLYLISSKRRDIAANKINQWFSSLKWCLFGQF